MGFNSGFKGLKSDPLLRCLSSSHIDYPETRRHIPEERTLSNYTFLNVLIIKFLTFSLPDLVIA